MQASVIGFIQGDSRSLDYSSYSDITPSIGRMERKWKLHYRLEVMVVIPRVSRYKPLSRR